jgi:uncharacterized membrane protein
MLCLRCGEESTRKSELCAYCGTMLRYPCSNGGGATSTGMDEKTAALLSYLLGWVTGLVFFFIESNKFVKFHAMQSILAFGSISAVLMVIGFIRSIMWAGFRMGGSYILLSLLSLVSSLLWIGMLILWVILMVKASQGETFKLPVVGDIAEKQLYVE